jgi:hypothetical protein
MCTGLLPLDEARFEQTAKEAVDDQLSYLVDAHFQMLGTEPNRTNFPKSNVQAAKIEFSDHRYDLEASPSFQGLVTMYHLYTVDVECQGLPSADFASIVRLGGVTYAFGWRWVTWQQALDMLHTRAQMMERVYSNKRKENQQKVKQSLETLDALRSAVERLESKVDHSSRAEVARLSKLVEILNTNLSEGDEENNAEEEATAKVCRLTSIPPSMVSELADRKLVSDTFLDESSARASQFTVDVPPARVYEFSGDATPRRGHQAPLLNVDARAKMVANSDRWYGFLLCSCSQKSGETPVESVESSFQHDPNLS